MKNKSRRGTARTAQALPCGETEATGSGMPIEEYARRRRKVLKELGLSKLSLLSEPFAPTPRTPPRNQDRDVTVTGSLCVSIS